MEELAFVRHMPLRADKKKTEEFVFCHENVLVKKGEMPLFLSCLHAYDPEVYFVRKLRE